MRSGALLVTALALLILNGAECSRHAEGVIERAAGGFQRSLLAAPCSNGLKSCQISPGKFACKACCKDADCPNVGATANTRCDSTGRLATWACVCKAGFDKCDCNANNGCETSLTTKDNCGRCGNTCGPNQDCINGDCTCKANFGECNGKLGDGCEASLQTDSKNCGQCGRACGAGEECKRGQCFCKGTTISDTDSVTTCGTCSNVCGKNMDCADGACVCKQAGLNAAGAFELWGNCDAVQSTGCEVNLMASDVNCGKCGAKCSTAEHEHCVSGQCTCDAGWGDCSPATPGCETNLLTSSANCGACGKVCGSNTVCVNGQCMACKAGWGNCDGNWDNGCEVNLSNSAANCGACGNACETFQKCVGGKKQCKTSLTENTSCGMCGFSCAPGEQCVTDAEDTPYCSCTADKKDCDGLRSNGCETDLSDPLNCGECGNVCADTEECRLDELAGFYTCTCNLPPEDLNTNDNCGQCGNVCYADGNEQCADGIAGTEEPPSYGCQCNPGFGDCDIDTPGCETELSTNDNCGACGNVCDIGLHCANTASPADPPVYECVCDNQDFSQLTNCGACGVTCAANQECSNVGGEGPDASFACVCKANFQDCNAAEEDPSSPDGCETDLTKPDNCGDCGVTCSDSEECRSDPDSGTSYCTCKSDDFTTNSNCGYCGNACNTTANEQCTEDLATGDFSCACADGFDSCDGQVGEGCLTPLNTMANCGACSQACVAGKETCENGACTCIDQDFSKNSNCGTCGSTCGTNQECVPIPDPAPSDAEFMCDCVADYADCDGKVATGCETSLLTSANCGACNTTCSAAETCSAAGCECIDQDFTKSTNCGTCGNTCGDNETCTFVDIPAGTDPNNQCLCDAGFADCDGIRSNGCETDITDPYYNCSACNDMCPAGQVCDSGFCVDQA